MLLPVHPRTTLIAIKPFPPQELRATQGPGDVRLSWLPPKSDGGYPITAYRVTAVANGNAQKLLTFVPNTKTRSVHVFKGLENGRTYAFVVQAVTRLGPGNSIVTPPITVGTPRFPRSVTATAGVGHAEVRWRVPRVDNGSTITGYIVTPYLGSTPLPSENFGANETTADVTGLNRGDTYSFGVTATNARGDSPPNRSNTVTIR
jgi:predicted RNA-binding protein with TRAM domain